MRTTRFILLEAFFEHFFCLIVLLDGYEAVSIEQPGTFQFFLFPSAGGGSFFPEDLEQVLRLCLLLADKLGNGQRVHRRQALGVLFELLGQELDSQFHGFRVWRQHKNVRLHDHVAKEN